VLEVMEWPKGAGGECRDISVSPPYRADAYITALSGSPPSSTLAATVTPNAISFRTPYHQPVTALEAGKYEVVVSDTSLRTGFQLVGAGANTKTGDRFRGTVRWRLNLRPGTYHYRADGSRDNLRQSFVVLEAGRHAANP